MNHKSFVAPLVALIVVPLMSTPSKSSALMMSSSPRPSTTSERSSAVIAVPFRLLSVMPFTLLR